MSITTHTTFLTNLPCLPIEGGHRITHLSKSCACSVHTLRGTPAKFLTINIDRRLAPGDPCRCEINTKKGRYDLAERWVITFRLYDPKTEPKTREGSVRWKECPHSWLLTAQWDDGGKWSMTFRRLTSDVDRTDPVTLRKMLIAHAFGANGGGGGYFHHLPEDEVQGAANEFVGAVIENPQWTRAEVYQCAGRILYRVSRSLGWRKLTLRERKKLGIEDGGQWRHESDLAEIYSQTGCGEYTLRAANGRPVMAI